MCLITLLSINPVNTRSRLFLYDWTSAVAKNRCSSLLINVYTYSQVICISYQTSNYDFSLLPNLSYSLCILFVLSQLRHINLYSVAYTTYMLLFNTVLVYSVLNSSVFGYKPMPFFFCESSVLHNIIASIRSKRKLCLSKYLITLMHYLNMVCRHHVLIVLFSLNQVTLVN